MAVIIVIMMGPLTPMLVFWQCRSSARLHFSPALGTLDALAMKTAWRRPGPMGVAGDFGYNRAEADAWRQAAGTAMAS